MADHDPRPPARGDEAELFRAFNDELVQTVARSVRVSSPETIEDACAFAWAKFMENQPDRDRNWRGWLFRVAQFESWRLERERSHDLPTREGAYAPHTWLVIDERDQYAISDDVDDGFSILQCSVARCVSAAASRSSSPAPRMAWRVSVIRSSHGTTARHTRAHPRRWSASAHSRCR